MIIADQNTPAAQPAAPHITQLRQALFDTLQDLRGIGRTGAPLDTAQVKSRVAIATTIKGVADTLVETARVEIDYLKATGARRSDFLSPDRVAPALPQPSATPTPHNPFPVSARNVCLHGPDPDDDDDTDPEGPK